METGRDKFAKHKKTIFALAGFFKMFGRSFNRWLLSSFRNKNGRVGLLVRYIALKNLCLKCGDNVSIHPCVIILSPEKLSIGSNISIHPFCYIDATGGIEIGDDVSIAHNCSILSTEHTWSDKGCSIKYNELEIKPTKLHNDVWLGCGVKVLGGTNIEDRVIVAAGGVVKGEISSNNIYGGIPAKIIKKINSNDN